MNFQDYFAKRQERINQYLEQILPPIFLEPERLHKAMRYAVLNGGKRIRPLLVYATGEALGGKPEDLDPVASAVELIHAYSLVHDDLPAMDNDDWRRGIPSCHKAFDEATAILVGDALQSLAFKKLTEYHETMSLKTLVCLINTLAEATGSRGMAGGQSLDLLSKGKLLSQKDIENINHLKTGALITASVKMGALTAQASETILNQLQSFAFYIGLCFQLKDDILDTAISPQEDEEVLVETSRKTKKNLEYYYDQAIQALNGLSNVDMLKKLAGFIVNRSF